jgi:hypothetical protein
MRKSSGIVTKSIRYYRFVQNDMGFDFWVIFLHNKVDKTYQGVIFIQQKRKKSFL